jgi:hypothetical protein
MLLSRSPQHPRALEQWRGELQENAEDKPRRSIRAGAAVASFTCFGLSRCA